MFSLDKPYNYSTIIVVKDDQPKEENDDEDYERKRERKGSLCQR